MYFFIIVYLALLVSYLFAERSGRKWWHASNKTALTLLYTLYGVWAFLRQPDPDTLAFRFLAALLFTAAGDILLIRFVIGGGMAFGIGNVCFAVYEMLLLQTSEKNISGRDAILPLVLLALVFWIIVCLFLYRKGAAGKPLLLSLSAGYLLCSALQGVTGLFLLTAFPAASANALLGIGSVFFWISDVLLLAYRIRFPKALAVLNLNSVFYFGGMLLIVLSRGI